MERPLYENQSSTLQRVPIVAYIFAINVALLAMCYWRVGSLIPSAMVRMDMPRPFPLGIPLNILVQVVTGGLLLGELGCVALWFYLSGRPVAKKVAVYVLAFLGVCASFVLITMSEIDLGYVARQFIILIGLAGGLLAITCIALRLAEGRLGLVRCSEFEAGVALHWITISQIILLTTVVAIAIAGAVASNSSPNLTLWLMPVILVGVLGLLPVSGLLIATSFKRLSVQFVICMVVAAALNLTNPAARTEWMFFFMSYIPIFLIVFTPVIWVRLLRRLGFAIESIEPIVDADQGTSTAIFDDVREVIK